MTARVYIVENHPLVRDMVRAYLARVPDIDICGSADTAEAALIELGPARASVVLVDLSLPQMSGVDLIAVIRARWPAICCVVLTGHRERFYLDKAMSAGATGYVFKGDPRQLREALAAATRGEQYVSPELREVV